MEILFADYASRVQEHLESFYGSRVVTRDIPDPLTGDLDGSEIHIDYAVTPEQRLFLLAHLFGHTVQWNVSLGAFELGRPQAPPVSEDCLPALMDYEPSGAASTAVHTHKSIIPQRWRSDLISRSENSGYDDLAGLQKGLSFR